MSISLYDASIPVFTLGLTNLSKLLEKADVHAATKKFDSKALVEARLIADMHPLRRQVQIACDAAKGAAARLAGVDVPKHEDNEVTLEELKARIAKTLEFIKSITREQLENAEARDVTLQFPSITLKFNGLTYITTFAIPNFFFHTTMVYALLRQNGVDIGKSDFIGAIQ